jgi:hypothetical protein
MRKATLGTGEAGIYKFLGSQYADHQTVLHAGREYVNENGYTTNNVENFFGQFKRGMGAPIASATRSICTAVSRNSNSATTIAPALASMTGNGRPLP